MKSTNARPGVVLVLILAALLTTQVYAEQGAAVSPAAVVNGLIAKEKSSWTLAIKRNAAAYRALHSRDFLTVSENGVIGRAQSEASALDAKVTFDTCTFSQMRVHWMDPDVALITYHVQFAGTDHGKKFGGDQYASSLWVRSGKQWLRLHVLVAPKALTGIARRPASRQAG